MSQSLQDGQLRKIWQIDQVQEQREIMIHKEAPWSELCHYMDHLEAFSGDMKEVMM